MAEVTSLPFRLLCRKYRVAMTFTEQISALAVTRDSKKTIEMASTSKKDSPVGLQLFGRNPEILVAAAKKLHKKFDVIDLNLGCPSKKIVKEGYGSALLKEKNKIKEIIEALVKNIPKPITVKMRSGFKKPEALEIAKVIEAAGCSAITIHARTQEQGYSGHADWKLIKQLKDNLSIPIIGNGDITDPISAEKMLKETGCDYIMVGRAARNNPWIFKQIQHYLKTGKIIKQTTEEKLDLFNEYKKLEHNFKLLKMRSLDFTKGISNSHHLRDQLSRAKDIQELEKLLNQLNKEDSNESMWN